MGRLYIEVRICCVESERLILVQPVSVAVSVPVPVPVPVAVSVPVPVPVPVHLLTPVTACTVLVFISCKPLFVLTQQLCEDDNSSRYTCGRCG
jgi:hypothetical protein